MAQYRNMGAPFPREHGGRVLRGEVLTPTAQELARWGYKLRFVAGDAMEAAAVPAGASSENANMAPFIPVEAADAPDADEAWPMAMTPARYLALYPDGPHAAQARALVGAPDDAPPEPAA